MNMASILNQQDAEKWEILTPYSLNDEDFAAVECMRRYLNLRIHDIHTTRE
jgi:hypothetical protein